MYSIKLGWFNTIKKVKGHLFIKENPHVMLIITENEDRFFVNTDLHKKIEFSKGWFEQEKKRVDEEKEKGVGTPKKS
jgi:hypothetical protein